MMCVPASQLPPKLKVICPELSAPKVVSKSPGWIEERIAGTVVVASTSEGAAMKSAGANRKPTNHERAGRKRECTDMDPSLWQPRLLSDVHPGPCRLRVQAM